MTQPAPRRYMRPEGECGVLVGTDVLLARSDSAAVVLRWLQAYSAGLQIALGAVIREDATTDRQDWRSVVDGSAPGGLRVGFAFAGAPMLTPPMLMPPMRPAFEGTPRWQLASASGGDNLYHFDLWLAPYPADGELRAGCVWGNQDIPLTATTLRLPTPGDIASRVLRIWD